MKNIGNPFKEWVQLEQPRLGTQVVFASDDFFAAKERVIHTPDPVFVEGKYDENGKWMDGWESRRRRTPGYDFCVVQLGIPGVIRGFDIDTSYFTGNYPPQASIDACNSDEEIPVEGWVELVGKIDLGADSHHYIPLEDSGIWTHLRLNIYPDGGVARLRIYGEAKPDFERVSGEIDLFAVHNGGRAIACSDEHFGSMHNLNLDGRGVNMGDGWETARRRGAGNDWVILRLGHQGVIKRVEVDTAHFKGNYPERVSIEGARFSANEDVGVSSKKWQTLLPETPLSMDKQHFFQSELSMLDEITHVRLSIYPDGGISRLRLFGWIA